MKHLHQPKLRYVARVRRDRRLHNSQSLRKLVWGAL